MRVPSELPVVCGLTGVRCSTATLSLSAALTKHPPPRNTEITTCFHCMSCAAAAGQWAPGELGTAPAPHSGCSPRCCSTLHPSESFGRSASANANTQLANLMAPAAVIGGRQGGDKLRVRCKRYMHVGALVVVQKRMCQRRVSASHLLCDASGGVRASEALPQETGPARRLLALSR